MKEVLLHFKNNAAYIFICCNLGNGSIDYLSVVTLVGNLSDLIFFKSCSSSKEPYRLSDHYLLCDILCYEISPSLPKEG